MNRRGFVGLTLTSLGSGLFEPASGTRLIEEVGRIKAIAFDAFAIFDPRPAWWLAEELYPGTGAKLSEVWRVRQFEYTWLRVLSRSYVDFWHITEDALIFAARQLGLQLTSEAHDRLMQSYLRLKAWPGVAEALSALKGSDFRLALLSNLTPRMLQANIKNASLSGFFEHAFSTDEVKTYKPDPRAYQLAADAWRLNREEIAFAAFAGWDAAGAKLFGYPTFWVNRLRLPAEELGVSADGTGADLSRLVDFVHGRGSR